VHDPDEYLATAKDAGHEELLYENILEAYRALYELKRDGKVESIGVGAKNWKTVQKISGDVPLDWVMIANSLTIKSHPKELLDFTKRLESEGIKVFNSAVFHSGFLVGGDYFDYKLVGPDYSEKNSLYRWRDDFFAICNTHHVKPAAACIQFALRVPGITSIALSTTDIKRIRENVELASVYIPVEFWEELSRKGLIHVNFHWSSEVWG
jgi:D-threo-aldose 1-dehydrogenase